MSRFVLSDTGPLYAPNDTQDEHHERAARDMERLAHQRREVLIAYPILLETYSLMLFRMGTHAALEWLLETGNATMVNPIPEDYTRASRTVRSLADQSITLVDATLAAIAFRMGVEVWTYDHHFDVMRVPVWR
jgi:predicted nucleic acid-binding protein